MLDVDNPNESVQGIFPISQCWKLDSKAYLKQDIATSSNKTKFLKFAQVLHGMTAQLDEEIDLIEGQQVVITEFIDKDWYRYIFQMFLHFIFKLRQKILAKDRIAF